MSAGIRIFWIISLCFLVTGCGSYMAVGIPGLQPARDVSLEGGERTVHKGDTVRVTLLDGREIKGHYQGLENGSLLVESGQLQDSSEDYGIGDYESTAVELMSLPVAQIRTLEVHEGDSGGAIAIVAGVVLITGAIAVNNAMDDFMEGPLITFE